MYANKYVHIPVDVKSAERIAGTSRFQSSSMTFRRSYRRLNAPEYWQTFHEQCDVILQPVGADATFVQQKDGRILSQALLLVSIVEVGVMVGTAKVLSL